jgi:hypothetical protein
MQVLLASLILSIEEAGVEVEQSAGAAVLTACCRKMLL